MVVRRSLWEWYSCIQRNDGNKGCTALIACPYGRHQRSQWSVSWTPPGKRLACCRDRLVYNRALRMALIQICDFSVHSIRLHLLEREVVHLG